MNPLSPENIVATVFTVALVLLVIFVALAVFFTARDDGSIGRPRWPGRYPAREREPRPGLFPASLSVLDAAGRLLHIRWPCWLIEWAWDRQATPGPEELLRRAKPRHRARGRWRP